MRWSLYQVSLRILSPIHIGWRKTGNLQQTRPYVTGKTLWGALTARLVRDLGNNNYQKMGKIVNDKLMFTYFYPTTDSSKVVVWPWDDSDKFSWMYLGSYASTALKDKIVDEGMLHETEYISTKTRDGKQVYLMGYIIEKEGCELAWREALKRIQIGGERGYGWGRVKLIDKPKKSKYCFNSYAFDSNRDIPQITVQKDKPILAHALVDGLNCNGTIEPFVGRETNENKEFGGVVSRAEICWIPGSAVKRETMFMMSEKGIWK
ncbi:MAG: hypothetical protein EF812_04365 [Methanosarcinales archaeon]|nr:MAG: hypothetical protein EF812_04365 [Methanosarcinales archaeon]